MNIQQLTKEDRALIEAAQGVINDYIKRKNWILVEIVYICLGLLSLAGIMFYFRLLGLMRELFYFLLSKFLFSISFYGFFYTGSFDL
jgi:hypothetical protein